LTILKVPGIFTTVTVAVSAKTPADELPARSDTRTVTVKVPGFAWFSREPHEGGAGRT
jgi:hypothetical protein